MAPTRFRSADLLAALALGLLLAAADAAAVGVSCPADAEGDVLQCGAGGVAGWEAPSATGGGAAACADLEGATSVGCAVVEADDAAAQRDALGLGTAATTASTAYDSAGAGVAAASEAVAAHAGAEDPHPGYLLKSAAAADVTATLIGHWSAAYGWGDHSVAGYLLDAAADGTLYGRQDGGWVPVATVEGPPGADGRGWTSGSYDAGTGVVTFASDDGLGFATGDLRGSDGAPGAPGPTAVSGDVGNAAVLGSDGLILVPTGTAQGTVASGVDQRFGLAETAVQPGAEGAAGIMPALALGDTADVAISLDGRAVTARLTGDGDLTVAAPADGTLRYATVYLTSDTGAWELSAPGAALWLDGAWAPLAPAVGEVLEVAIRRLPDGTLLLSARPYY